MTRAAPALATAAMLVLALAACGSSTPAKKEAGAATDCTPAVMVVRHAEDQAAPQPGPDILSPGGKRHANLYPKLFTSYLSVQHGIGPGGAKVAVCPIGKVIAINPYSNPQNTSPGKNPYDTIKPLADSRGLAIKTGEDGGDSYSTVYNWNTARRKTLLTPGSSTVIAWDKQGLNPSAADLRDKTINGKPLGEYDYKPLLQALPVDRTAIVGTSGYYTPQRTDFYVFAVQDPDTGKFASAKAYKQWFSNDEGKTWYYRAFLEDTDPANDIKAG